MGEIVDLASERGYRTGRDPEGLSPHGPAHIVLYTGVRYERHEEPLPPSGGKSPRTKRGKPKNA